MIPTKRDSILDPYKLALLEAVFGKFPKRRDPKQRGEYKKAKRRSQNAKMRRHKKRNGQA